MRELTHSDKMEAVRIATSGLTRRFGDELAEGVTDDRLRELIKEALGIFGGCGSRDRLHVSHQGSGLKIWASWHIHNHVLDKPIFEGERTLRVVRELYGISDPSNGQMSLF